MWVRENTKEINAADVEHISALALGAILMLAGFKKGGLIGTAMKLGGLASIYRGQQGYSRLHRLLGRRTPERLTGVGKQNIRIDAEIEIDCPRRELYRVWRNLENLPIFMEHLVSVHEIDDERSLWVARAPAGMVVKWDAVIVNDVEDQIIAWETLEGSGVDMAGSVRFEEVSPDRTKLDVVLRFDPPADLAGYWLARALGSDPQKQIERDLRRFKAIMETSLAISDEARHPKAQML